MLQVIIIGYNEEKNLDKCLSSISNFDGLLKYNINYIDQTSTDNSIKIAEKYTNNIYIHKNKGYADPDKKWAVENILNMSDWGLIIDADEEITYKLAKEMSTNILLDKIKIFYINIKVYYLGNSFINFKQLRLFKKDSIIISDKIHEYIKKGENIKYKIIKESIINRDKRDIGNFIYNHINKINRYSEKEIDKYINTKKYKIILLMFLKPVYIFLKWGFYNKLFFQGISGIIVTINISFYTFIIYSKLYEKKYIKNY